MPSGVEDAMDDGEMFDAAGQVAGAPEGSEGGLEHFEGVADVFEFAVEWVAVAQEVVLQAF